MDRQGTVLRVQAQSAAGMREHPGIPGPLLLPDGIGGLLGSPREYGLVTQDISLDLPLGVTPVGTIQDWPPQVGV